MKEFHEFLVPIDFSETSHLALESAYTLAKHCGGAIFLLHVIDLPGATNPMYSHYTSGAALGPAERQQLETELAAQLTELIPKDPDYAGVRTVVRVVSHTTPADAIVAEASAVGADVIFIAHRGWSSLKNLLVGSTAERVIRHAPCPVMVIRAKT